MTDANLKPKKTTEKREHKKFTREIYQLIKGRILELERDLNYAKYIFLFLGSAEISVMVN